MSFRIPRPLRKKSRASEMTFRFSLSIYKLLADGTRKLVYLNPDDPPARAWIDICYCNTRYSEFSGIPMKRTNWSDYTMIYNQELVVHGSEGQVDRGIIVGAGTRVPAMDDYCMDSVISHGLSTGELWHRETVMNYPVALDKSVSMDVTRVIINKTSSPIRVNEVGLYGNHTGTGYIFMLCRDVFEDGVLFEPGNAHAFNYRLEIRII